jgi:hypothetical protein
MAHRGCAASKVLAASVVYAACTTTCEHLDTAHVSTTYKPALSHTIAAGLKLANPSFRMHTLHKFGAVFRTSTLPLPARTLVLRRMSSAAAETSAKATAEAASAGLCPTHVFAFSHMRMQVHAAGGPTNSRDVAAHHVGLRACASSCVSVSACLHAVFLMAVIADAGAGAAGGAGAAAPGGLAGIC